MNKSKPHQKIEHKKNYIIYGKHAVTAALLNKHRKIIEVFCTISNLEYVKKISANNKITIVENEKLRTIAPENVPHQGIAAMVGPVASYNIAHEILSNPKSKIVILDQITDPQNFGAILRSAAAFGIDALIYQKDRSAFENGSIAKAASGALDIVPIIEVVNINNTMQDLKKNGFWIIGLDGEATQDIRNSKILEGKLALIMGSEGVGLRPLIAKNCDLLVKIPMSKQMESLNVSNAAAIAFYEIFITAAATINHKLEL